MRSIGWIATIVALVGAGPALGHEGGIDVRGVVVAADAAQVTVRGADGKETRFAVARDTRVFVERHGAKPAELKPGVRAVIHGRERDGRLEAASIHASAPAGSVPAAPRPAR